MDRIEIVMDAINALVPGAQYNIYGNFSGLQWLDSRTAPTESEVQTKYDELIAAEPLNEVRTIRNAKLAETDWVVIKEREEGGSVSNFADWKTYRQALRDITNSATSLDDVTWPEKPE